MPAKRVQRPTARKRVTGKRASNPARLGKTPATPRRAKARPVRAAAPARPAPEPTPPSFLEVTPSLAVRDVARSLVFYRRLGFEPTAQLPPTGRPEWVRLERDRVAILVWNEVLASPEVLAAMAHGRGAGNAVRIAVADADGLAQEIQENGACLRRAPETMPEGVRELSVTDPDGYIIEFAQRLPSRRDGAGRAP